jgi:hypothetical protein
MENDDMMRVRENQTKQLVSERDYLSGELRKLDQAYKEL